LKKSTRGIKRRLGSRKEKKIRRKEYRIEICWTNTQKKCCLDGKIKSMKEKEKENGKRYRKDGKKLIVPWDKELLKKGLYHEVPKLSKTEDISYAFH